MLAAFGHSFVRPYIESSHPNEFSGYGPVHLSTVSTGTQQFAISRKFTTLRR